MGCHLLRLSSGLQLTDTNSSVLNSCEISSEAFALPLGGTVFSGLCSLVPGLKTRPLTAWWSQRGRTYMVLFQRWGHVGRMTSQFRLYLKWSWLENKGNCCVLIISLITVNNATIDSEPVVFSSVLLTSEKMGNKEWEKTGCFSYWRDALAHDSSSLNSNVWSSSRQSVIKLSQWKCCSTDKDISGTTIRDSTFPTWSESFSYQESCRFKPLLCPSCQQAPIFLHIFSIFYFVTFFALFLGGEIPDFYCLQTSIPKYRPCELSWECQAQEWKVYFVELYVQVIKLF